MSLYEQLVPMYIKYLGNLSAMLDKAVQFCEEKGISHEEMLSFRLVEDQKGLPYQVQSCSNTAKLAMHRLGAKDMPYFDDSETTFAELKARLDRTIEVLQGVDRASIEGGDVASQELLMETKVGSFRFASGQRYVSEFAIPNFHFHLSTAYCILRHKGVPLGALDYMRDVFEKVES